MKFLFKITLDTPRTKPVRQNNAEKKTLSLDVDFLKHTLASGAQLGWSTTEKNYFNSLFIKLTTVNKLAKKPFYKNRQTDFVNKLIKLNTKRGYKLRAYSFIAAAINEIYNTFQEFDPILYSEYREYLLFFNFAKSFPEEFYAPSYLLTYIYQYTELVFLLKRIRTKKRKKTQIQTRLKISYVGRGQRQNITLRLINEFCKAQALPKVGSRYVSGLLYLFLSGRRSFLYKKKMSLYNKLLEKKKFY